MIWRQVIATAGGCRKCVARGLLDPAGFHRADTGLRLAKGLKYSKADPLPAPPHTGAARASRFSRLRATAARRPRPEGVPRGVQEPGLW